MEFREKLAEALTDGTWVLNSAYMDYVEYEVAEEYNMKWYRSRERSQAQDTLSMPFTSYLMNKKWTLQESFNNHMLRFQQVTVISK